MSEKDDEQVVVRFVDASEATNEEQPVRFEQQAFCPEVMIRKMTNTILRWMCSHEKDKRENCCIGEELERFRGEEARDLKRSESGEFVEKWTCLNALGKQISGNRNMKNWFRTS